MKWPFHTQQEVIYIRGSYNDSVSSLLVQYTWQTPRISETYRNRLRMSCSGEPNICMTMIMLTMDDSGTYICTAENDAEHKYKMVLVTWG